MLPSLNRTCTLNNLFEDNEKVCVKVSLNEESLNIQLIEEKDQVRWNNFKNNISNKKLMLAISLHLRTSHLNKSQGSLLQDQLIMAHGQNCIGVYFF